MNFITDYKILHSSFRFRIIGKRFYTRLLFFKLNSFIWPCSPYIFNSLHQITLAESYFKLDLKNFQHVLKLKMFAWKNLAEELVLRSLRASPFMRPFLTLWGLQEEKCVYWKVSVGLKCVRMSRYPASREALRSSEISPDLSRKIEGPLLAG